MYKIKYLKYKMKYLNLKNQLKGGALSINPSDDIPDKGLSFEGYAFTLLNKGKDKKVFETSKKNEVVVISTQPLKDLILELDPIIGEVQEVIIDHDKIKRITDNEV